MMQVPGTGFWQGLGAHIYAFFLALVCLVGIIVLTAMNKTVPTDLSSALWLFGGGGLGLSLPVGK